MLDLSLLAPPAPSTTSKSPDLSLDVLAHSRRPAILTYVSPIIDTASTISALPWYILGWKSEKDVLEVSMFEGVVFARGWRNLPESVKVVIEADKKMQFYEISVKIVAKFSGLRYLPILCVLNSGRKHLSYSKACLDGSSTTTAYSLSFSSQLHSGRALCSPPGSLGCSFIILLCPQP